MKSEYDFSKGRRGAIVEPTPGKERITIRLDADVLDWFRTRVEKAGGGSYQAMINAALRDHMEQDREQFEATLRRILREELGRAS